MSRGREEDGGELWGLQRSSPRGKALPLQQLVGAVLLALGSGVQGASAHRNDRERMPLEEH